LANRALGYVRVSTKEQKEEGISVEAQTKMIQDYCSLRQLDLIEILTDPGVSAYKPLETRPAGKELLARVKEKEAEAVVAVKLDRLFRNARDCLAVVDEWDRGDVALHFVSLSGASIDTRSAMGRFFLTVMAAVAEMERNLIRERTKEALAYKKQKKERTGTLPYGYRTGLNGKTLEIDPPEQRTIDYILRLRDEEGFSNSGIAKRLNAEGVPSRGKRWHTTTITRLFRRLQDLSWRPELPRGRRPKTEVTQGAFRFVESSVKQGTLEVKEVVLPLFDEARWLGDALGSTFKEGSKEHRVLCARAAQWMEEKGIPWTTNRHLLSFSGGLADVAAADGSLVAECGNLSSERKIQGAIEEGKDFLHIPYSRFMSAEPEPVRYGVLYTQAGRTRKYLKALSDPGSK